MLKSFSALRNLFFAFILLSSSTLMALGYVNIHGNLERTTLSETNWNAFGAGIGVGVRILDPFYLEGYFDYLKHVNSMYAPLNMAGTSYGTYSIHFGGKVGFKFLKFFIIKTGIGLARTSSKNDLQLTDADNDLEFVASAGTVIPATKRFGLSLEVLYRKLFSSAYRGTNFFSGLIGLVINF